MRTRSSVRSWLFLAVLTCVVGFMACAGGNGRSPRGDADGEVRVVKSYRGFATFYGPGLHGARTASGETFDSRRMVAAHRTLPLGTRVRVTNLRNGETVVLRIADRGPYSKPATIIDVSHGAARRLGFVEQGRAPVRVEVLESVEE